MDEFERIEHYFAPLAANRKEALGLKDDAALYNPPKGKELILTMDAIIENIHFLKDSPPSEIAERLIAVNLSDLAAKAATPYAYLLTLALPKTHGDVWLSEFVNGLKNAQNRYNIGLFGGDSVHLPKSSPAMLSLTAIGTVPKGKAVLRSTAKEDDDIYVSGYIGDAYLGLTLCQNKISAPITKDEKKYLKDKFLHPSPRLELIPLLREYASSAADVSDGLLSDINHISKASKLSARIYQEKIPFSNAAKKLLADNKATPIDLITGGDDYEIIFTAPPENAQAIKRAAKEANMTISKIGTIESKTSKILTLIDQNGNQINPPKKGYNHF